MAPLTVMNLSAYQVEKKTEGLVDLLRTYEVDIAVITDTYLDPGTEWSIPSYNVVRRDCSTGSLRPPSGTDQPVSWRSLAGRKLGVAILVRDTISFNELPDTGTSSIESIGVELEVDTGVNLKIFAVYCHWYKPKDMVAVNYPSDLRKLTLTRGKYLIAGNLNAFHRDLGHKHNNMNGYELVRLAQKNNFTVYFSDEPTSERNIFLANFEIDKPLAIDSDLFHNCPVICNIKGEAVGLNSDGVFSQLFKHLYQTVGAMFGARGKPTLSYKK